MDRRPDKHGTDNTADYDRWVTEKVSVTMARVAGGKTRLLTHSDATAILERRLMARINNAQRMRKPL